MAEGIRVREISCKFVDRSFGNRAPRSTKSHERARKDRLCKTWDPINTYFRIAACALNVKRCQRWKVLIGSLENSLT